MKQFCKYNLDTSDLDTCSVYFTSFRRDSKRGREKTGMDDNANGKENERKCMKRGWRVGVGR